MGVCVQNQVLFQRILCVYFHFISVAEPWFSCGSESLSSPDMSRGFAALYQCPWVSKWGGPLSASIGFPPHKTEEPQCN